MAETVARWAFGVFVAAAIVLVIYWLGVGACALLVLIARGHL